MHATHQLSNINDTVMFGLRNGNILGIVLCIEIELNVNNNIINIFSLNNRIKIMIKLKTKFCCI